MTIRADTSAEEIGLKASDLFSYQFTLAPDGVRGPEGFAARPFGERRLFHCPKLEVATLFDRTGAEIGYCLGVAVDKLGVRVEGWRRLEVTLGAPDFWDGIEDLAVGLAGRWLLLVRGDDAARIYGDAAGMMNCIYDPKLGMAGATLLTALDREIVESDEVDYRNTIARAQRMPFGRTRDAFARRLSVNHFLSLDDMSETRYWPRPGDFAEVAQGGELAVISEIRDRLGAIMAGIATSLPTAVAVSGGNDSRNLLAAGKSSLGHIKRFYSHTFNFNSRTDFRSAALMMETLGFEVERYAKAAEDFTEEEIAERNRRYQITTGWGVPLHQMSNVKLATYPPAGEVILTGNVMEALRAAHWKSSVTERPNALKFGLKRCLYVNGKDFTGDFVRQWMPEYKTWIAGLPEDARARYVDAVFPEHNLPFLGTFFHSYQDNFYLCPYNDRRLIALTASLPVPYRFSNEANRAFLAMTAPELVDVPFAEDLRKARQTAA